MNLSTLLMPLAFLMSLFAASSSSRPSLASETSVILHKNQETAQAVVTHYAHMVHAAYSDLAASTQALKTAIGSFVRSPDSIKLDAAKTAWIESRKIYGLTEAFRFYGGPIDDPKTGPEGLMNAWPLDEGYIDSVKDNPRAGYINNPKLFPVITRDILLSLNEKDGEKNISTGYHAIEFLLWGQDFSPTGPGNRPVSDYVDNGFNNATRRAETLTLLTELLNDQAQELALRWDLKNEKSYAALFVKSPTEGVQNILTGLATLSVDELAGERILVPLETNDEENEQSCFSDTTMNDHIANAQGILNIYMGTYGKMNGPGLKSLIEKADAKLANSLQKQMEESVASLKQIKSSFDRVIASEKNSAERKTAQKAIESLEEQGKLMASAAKKLGVELNIQE